MGMIAPHFEQDAVKIGTNLAVGASAQNTSILQLGQVGSNKSGPFCGVLFHYTVTQSGGTSDSNLTVANHLSYDGVTALEVDDESVLSWTIASSATGTSGTHYFTKLISATEHLAGLATAFRQTISRATGDRALVVNVWARRFWMEHIL